MRIAVPVSNDRTAETLSGIEGFQFLRTITAASSAASSSPARARAPLPRSPSSSRTAWTRSSAGALPGDERLETAAAGILLFPTFSGTPEEAALAFLGGTVARDPNNKCNACGFQSSCSLSGKGGCGRDLTQKSVPASRNAFLPFSSGAAQAAGGHLDRRLAER